MKFAGDKDLVKIARKYLREEPRFELIKKDNFEILWCNPKSFEKKLEAWGLSWTDRGLHKVRLNKLLSQLQAPNVVTTSIVVHELIHFLPGCQLHNDTFWDHEINILGNDYYEATVWLRQHSGHFYRCYNYRNRSWLASMINQDQLRIKDMAQIAGCSERTIRRWMKKYDLHYS